MQLYLSKLVDPRRLRRAFVLDGFDRSNYLLAAPQDATDKDTSEKCGIFDARMELVRTTYLLDVSIK
jgi:hypothetical protein